MKYHTLFFPKLGKMSQNLSSAAVRIGALRVMIFIQSDMSHNFSLAPLSLSTLLPTHVEDVSSCRLCNAGNCAAINANT